jgi:hypothetical protein
MLSPQFLRRIAGRVWDEHYRGQGGRVKDIAETGQV